MGLRLIAIDLDETLLKRDKSYDEARFSRILDKLKQKGIIVCIASGNYMPKIREYITADNHDKLYLAGDNGNIVIANNETVGVTTISDRLFHEITAYLADLGAREIIVSNGQQIYSTYVSDESREYVQVYYERVQMIASYADLPADFEITKIAILAKTSLGENKKLKQEISMRFENIAVVTSGGGWVDIYSEDGGKGAAIKYLQAKYAISKAETIAFGDSLNDESMMHEAAFSVAMNNADSDLKRVCRYEIGSNEEQAVLGILEDYLHHDDVAFLENYRLDD